MMMVNAAREQLHATVCCAILELPEPTLDAVRKRIFPGDDGRPPDSTAEATLRATHSAQLRIAILAHCKEAMTTAMEQDADAASAQFAGVPREDRFAFLKGDLDAQRLLRGFPADSPEANSICHELEAFQRKLARSLQSTGLSFRDALMDWLRSGEPSKEAWSALREWNEAGGRLGAFRRRVHPLIAEEATGSAHKLLEAANNLADTDEFVDKEQIHEILDQCCSYTSTKTDGHLRIHGATLAASLLVDGIREHLTSSEPPPTVSIYAVDCCSLDVSLDGPEWSGINLCIVTRRLYVHAGIAINLSGRSFEPTTRPNSEELPGAAGKSGRAGASSGNLCILAAEFIGADRLTVTLNGGRGENGQNGAIGKQGTAGRGVTEAEIRAMDFPGERRSPEEAACTTFQHFDNWICARAKLYEFTDTKGQRVMYSTGGSPRQTFVFVRGTLGESGGWGGAGGPGGGGGYAGEHHISDFDDRKPSLLKIECKHGDAGADGTTGGRGPPGDNGNDMYYCITEGKPPKHRSSTRGKKFLASESTAFFTPANGLLLPHTTSFFCSQTYVEFKEYDPELAQGTAPQMEQTDRATATAKSTVQASTARSEFEQVSGNTLSFRRGTAATAATDEVGRARMQTREGVHMVRERSPGAEERYGEDDDDEEEAPEPPRPRPCLLAIHEIIQQDQNVELWRPSTLRHLLRSGGAFDSQFRQAQAAVLRQNSVMTTRLEDFLGLRPSSAQSEESITSLFGKRSAFHVDFALNAFNMTDNSPFLRLFAALIEADGPQPCTVKWRAIVDVMRALALHCDWTVLALAMASTPLDDLLDTLIHLRLMIVTHNLNALLPDHQGHRPLWSKIREIKSTEARALLLLKIDAADGVDTEELLEVLTLLRHADGQLRQLSHVSYREWVDIARRQNWMLADQENFGPLAYYLGVLARAGFAAEERGMRAVLAQWTHSKQLFARFVHCIVSRELVANEDFCSRMLTMVREGSRMDVLSLLPDSARSLDDVAALVRGMTDADDSAIASRQGRMAAIVKAIKASPPVTVHAMHLAKFDDALKSTTGKRLRAVQKMVVMAAMESPAHLMQQVSTGEGKSFIIAAIAAIRCLMDKTATVDVISSSSVLAERDATHLQPLFGKLGLSVAHNCHESREKREIAYKSRIVYGDMAHFQRDYLLHTFYRKNIRGERQLDKVIVDEVDSMTLDSGNHVLYLSHKLPSMKLLDSLFGYIQREVYSNVEVEQDTEAIRQRVLRDIYGYVLKEDIAMMDSINANRIYEVMMESAFIDDEGFILEQQTENLFVLTERLNAVGDSRFIPLIIDAIRMEMEREREIFIPFHLRNYVRLHISTFIDNCKRARVMRPNVDYVLDVDHSDASANETIVMIVDSSTGADLTSTQWSGGLHQFLQMKHACRMTPMSLKAVFISNVTFLRKYMRLDGLSGTLGSLEESRTLAALYKVDLIRMPTHQTRRMIEYVPTLCHTHADWIDSVYKGVCQVIGSNPDKAQSVLIICETIEQLQQLQVGLVSRCSDQEGDRQALVKTAIDNAIIYTRQHEELVYEERELECGKLILSTNLAGRGTDILITKELEANYGLHVIIAFVPRNKRIEEQAMGRAARCGAWGSGEIIAHVRPTRGDIAPSFLDFQTRRDNEEVVRIQALRHHFEFRIAVEEEALERFRHAIDHKLFREAAINERMPDAEDIVYRALLDEWTLWLDAKDEEIKRCADRRDAQQKEAIIQSVDAFLESHPVEKPLNPAYGKESFLRSGQISEFLARAKPTIDKIDKLISPHLLNKQPEVLFRVPEWMRAGEWLLRLGIVQACHKKGHADAARTFTRVAEDGEALAPFAQFYLACLSMTRFEDMRERQLSLHLSARADYTSNVDQAIRLFARSRIGFMEQLQRRTADVRAIQQRAQGSSCADCGLQRQLREHEAAVQQIVANIDWLIGEPMSPASFHPLIEDAKRQKQLFEALKSIDVFSYPELAADPIPSHYHRIIRRKFGIAEGELTRALESDTATEDPADHLFSISAGPALTKRCTLPSRLDFWKDMHALGVFRDIQHVYVINVDMKEKVTSALGVPPMVFNEARARTGILFSNHCLRDVCFYKKSELDSMISSNLVEDLANKLRTLQDNGSIELDMVARIEFRRLHNSHLLQFDGFTQLQLTKHFNLDEATSNWVLHQLIDHGILAIQSLEMVRLMKDWESKSERFPWNMFNVSMDAEKLRRFERLENAYTISPEVLIQVIGADPGNNNDDSIQGAQELFDSLIDEGVLKRIQQTVYRQGSRLDCSMLPSTLVEPMLHFLSHHFSFTFARQALSSACADSDHDPYTVKEVMLPSDAHQELFDELTQLEVISPPRMTSDQYELIDYDDFPFVEKRELEMFIHSRRQKLRDSIQMFALIPFLAVLTETGAAVTSEMEALIDVGMAAGISLRKVSVAKKVAGALFTCGRFLVNCGLLLIKGVAKVIGAIVGGVTFVAGAVLGAAGNLIRRVAPDFAKTLHTGASKAVDAIGRLQKKITQLPQWLLETLWAMAGAISSRIEGDLARVIGRAIHNGFTYFVEKCTALFGSAEYYDQCRRATHKLGSRLSPGETMGEFRLIRLFNNIGAATEEQSRRVSAREQELIDQISRVARQWKAEMFDRLLPPPNLSFSGLAACIDTLESKRWFESELELSLQWLAMEARRELIDTGRVENIACRGIQHLTVAYAALWKDVEEQQQQSAAEETVDTDDHIEKAIKDIIDVKMTDLFTNPTCKLMMFLLVNFIRSIISECFASEKSQPHQNILDTDIAMAAKQLCKTRSTAWLETLQNGTLVFSVHTNIMELYQQMIDASSGGERMAHKLIELMRICLLHRIPMPYEPCASILCLISEDVENCIGMELDSNHNNSNDSSRRYVTICKEIVKRNVTHDNVKTLRGKLIRSLAYLKL